MEVRFEDHAGFHRAAGFAAAGGGVLAAVAPHFAAVPAAIAGSAFAVALAGGLKTGEGKRRMAAAVACAVAAAAWLAMPDPWLLPAAGALLGLLFALSRGEGARASRWTVLLSAALGGATGRV